MKKTYSRHPGFTLVELLVVIVIILVLAAILIPTVKRMRDGASAAGCASNMRQCVAMGILFTTEHSGRLPRLHLSNGLMMSELGKDSLPIQERIVSNGAVHWWPDLLTTYAEGASIFSCPKLTKPAVAGPGGGQSNHIPLGIGINYHSMAQDNRNGPGNGYVWTRVSEVPDQSRVVWFADAGGEATGPWKDRVDVPGTGSCFFRGNSDDGRCVMPRHGGKINVAYMDGRVSLVNPNEINWNGRQPGGGFVGYTRF